MKKAIVTIVILGGLAAAGYGCYRAGYIDKWFPGLLKKVIPGYEAVQTSGRVSSDDADAVFVDSVSVIADLGSGNGMIPRFAGVIEPQETKEYKLDGDRKVKQCYVKEGDDITKGQKLFVYDTSTDEDKLEQTQIDLERLENTASTSEAKKEELKKQLEKANTPEKKLAVLTQENQIKQNELEIKSKKKSIEQLKSKIANATVCADLDGVVKSINDKSSSDSGSDSMTSDSGSSAYITILKTGTYRVKAQANEQNIGQIYQGESILVFSRVDDSVVWNGTISKIKTDQGTEGTQSGTYSDDSSSSSGSSNYPFYVDLDSSDGLMLGQHVYLEENLGQDQKKSGIWLDDYYLLEENGKTYVWTASDKNKLVKKEVGTGDKDEELGKTQIKSGLTAGDYICEPNEKLEEGLPVIYNDASGQSQTESPYQYDAGITDTSGAYQMDGTEWQSEAWNETETEIYDEDGYVDLTGETENLVPIGSDSSEADYTDIGE